MSKPAVLFLATLVLLVPASGFAQFRDQDEAEKHVEHEERDEGDEEHDEEEMELNEEQILVFIAKHLPHVRKKLASIKKKNPEEYEEHLWHLAEAIEHYNHLREEQPDRAAAHLAVLKLESECQGLAHTINTAEGKAQREALKKQLREKLSQTFDLRMKERERELSQLEAEVAEIKALLLKRSKNRDRIIDRRLQELTAGDDEDLEWW